MQSVSGPHTFHWPELGHVATLTASKAGAAVGSATKAEEQQSTPAPAARDKLSFPSLSSCGFLRREDAHLPAKGCKQPYLPELH